MNYKAITLAAILGISTPAIIDVAMPQPALAQKFNYPKGHFADKDWEVSLSEVLNVKILRILSKLCIGIGDTKFEQLMTLFSIDNGFYLGKTQRL